MVAKANTGPQLTYKSGAAIDQYRAVKISAADTVIEATSPTADFTIGVSQNAASAANKAVAVLVRGQTKMKAGGSISAGDRLTCTTDGAAIATTTPTNIAFAVALEAASSGEIFSALIVGPFFAANAS